MKVSLVIIKEDFVSTFENSILVGEVKTCDSVILRWKVNHHRKLSMFTEKKQKKQLILQMKIFIY